MRFLVIPLCLVVFSLAAQDPAGTASAFMATLSDQQLKKIQFGYDDSERFNWAFVPTSRNGLSFHDMSEQQKASAMSLMKEWLSLQGYNKASGIMLLEGILREVEGRDKDDTYRDPLNYYFTIFGTPSSTGVWGWRIEGHHLALNFTSIDGLIASSTPSFFGANPATVKKGASAGKQTLKLESDLGFTLINSMNNEQLKIARFSDRALPEIVTGNDRNGKLLEPRGISYPELTNEQKKIFMQLLDVYVKNYQLGFSKKLMDKINKAGIENLSFAWAGSMQPGDGHYYRIQGPMLLIEYDNTQTQANHVHTVVRDLTNDFAEDILREHYAKEHR